MSLIIVKTNINGIILEKSLIIAAYSNLPYSDCVISVSPEVVMRALDIPVENTLYVELS